jgi:protein-tyrosine phosphatase
LKWEDTPKQLILKDLPMCFEFIEKGIQKGKVYVHCQQGISRSATIVIAWIMYKYEKSFEEAFAFVQKARPVIHPNVGFVNQLYVNQ